MPDTDHPAVTWKTQNPPSMSENIMKPDNSNSVYQELDDEFLHSATIIDADGNEIAITKEMIDMACDKLANQIEKFEHPAKSANQ